MRVLEGPPFGVPPAHEKNELSTVRNTGTRTGRWQRTIFYSPRRRTSAICREDEWSAPDREDTGNNGRAEDAGDELDPLFGDD